MKTAVVLGGTGSLGATVERLARDGWQVTATGRNPRVVPTHWADLGSRSHPVARNEPDTMAAVVGDGCDLLVGGQCYAPEQAEGPSTWSHRGGSAVMLSARAVRVDAFGRSTNSEEPPEGDGPTNESHPRHHPAAGRLADSPGCTRSRRSTAPATMASRRSP